MVVLIVKGNSVKGLPLMPTATVANLCGRNAVSKQVRSEATVQHAPARQSPESHVVTSQGGQCHRLIASKRPADILGPIDEGNCSPRDTPNRDSTICRGPPSVPIHGLRADVKPGYCELAG